MHILVVEDDVALTRRISAALMTAGHDPVVIHDGEAALHAAAESAFDLIVIDIGLPRMDGFELLRRLRSLHVQIELSARELMLVKVLMREPGRVFSRTELCQRVWEHEHEYDTKLVEVFIGRLRKKLAEPQLIRTVRHVGYTIREPL
jgi:DNA-binding response OmpR family regulator